MCIHLHEYGKLAGWMEEVAIVGKYLASYRVAMATMCVTHVCVCTCMYACMHACMCV